MSNKCHGVAAGLKEMRAVGEPPASAGGTEILTMLCCVSLKLRCNQQVSRPAGELASRLAGIAECVASGAWNQMMVPYLTERQ